MSKSQLLENFRLPLIGEHDFDLPAEAWDFAADQNEELESALWATVDALGLKSLSGPLVGLNKRVILLNASVRRILFNPYLGAIHKRQAVFPESCPLDPTLFIDNYRYPSITVNYFNTLGLFQKEKFNGIDARILQHELDHISGFCFKNNMDRLKLERAKRKRAKALERKTA